MFVCLLNCSSNMMRQCHILVVCLCWTLGSSSISSSSSSNSTSIFYPFFCHAGHINLGIIHFVGRRCGSPTVQELRRYAAFSYAVEQVNQDSRLMFKKHGLRLGYVVSRSMRYGRSQPGADGCVFDASFRADMESFGVRNCRCVGKSRCRLNRHTHIVDLESRN